MSAAIALTGQIAHSAAAESDPEYGRISAVLRFGA
jgi:hypothetical protein